MSKNTSRGIQSPRLKAFMSKAYVRNVLLLVVLSFSSASLKAQDILVFKSLEQEEVVVLSATPSEVKYRQYNDDSGEVHVAKSSDLFYVRYENGKTHHFKNNDKSNYSYTLNESSSRLLTFQFDFLVQDAWGAGLMIRRELNPYIGLNIAGASYLSGWRKHEGPSSVGFINIRALGIRLYTPYLEPCRLFAEVTPGYTHVYVDSYVPGWGRLKGDADCFGLDFCAGFEIGKHVALGYNLDYIVNGNASGTTHWGKVSILF